jgi:hypothetical protein
VELEFEELEFEEHCWVVDRLKILLRQNLEQHLKDLDRPNIQEKFLPRLNTISTDSRIDEQSSN